MKSSLIRILLMKDVICIFGKLIDFKCCICEEEQQQGLAIVSFYYVNNDFDNDYIPVICGHCGAKQYVSSNNNCESILESDAGNVEKSTTFFF